MLLALFRDEAGFLVSAELVIVATMLVIGLIVGMSEVQHAVSQELGDLGTAIGRINQSYYYTGYRATTGDGVVKSFVAGSFFIDEQDVCDDTIFITGDSPVPEGEPIP